MKELLIMRHAKSDWTDGSASDFDRGLNQRGLNAAPRMGQFLQECGLKPDKIISSPARRAKTTAELVARSLSYSSVIEFDEDFYYGFTQHYFLALQKLDDSLQLPLLVGHNPIVENLVQLLASDPDVRINMSTATIVHLRTPINYWVDLRPNSCEIIRVQKPKEL